MGGLALSGRSSSSESGIVERVQWPISMAWWSDRRGGVTGTEHHLK